jgi:hypothetical protein
MTDPTVTTDEPVGDEEPGPDLSVNIAYQCAMKGSVSRFVTCFENEEDPYHEVILYKPFVFSRM